MSAISCGDCGGAYCLRPPPRFWSAFARTKEVGPRSRLLEASAEADGYVTSLKEAARFCIDAARSLEPQKSETPEDDSAPKDDKGREERQRSCASR